MKNRFTVRFTAAILTAGIYCLYSPHPCVIHAGEAQEYIHAVWATDSDIVMSAEGSDIFFFNTDKRYPEDISTAAKACIETLGDPGAVVDDGAGGCVYTGFTGDYETAREIYSASRDLYCGNVGYSMEYERCPNGDVRLFFRTWYGTPVQAYKEHTEAKQKLKEISDSFHGTDAEKAEQTFQWVCSHVAYADDETIWRLEGMGQGCVPDYTGIHATTYTAVMDGVTTCSGFSGMLLTLLDMEGIPAMKIKNHLHAYNAALVEGRWVLYDAASGVSGDPGSFSRRYRDYYEPQELTCGFSAYAGED